LNGETKHYLKAIGVSYCSRTHRWVLAGAQKTATGSRILGFASVSDGMAVASEAEKLLEARLGDEENPVMVSVAADTAQVGFYPFTVPVADGAKLEAFIAAQAESIIPMPLPQTAFTWRIIQKDSAVGHGFLCAVRKSYYQELTGLAAGRVGSVLPDATGLARAWAAMFESTPQSALLIDLRQHHCILALCEREKLVRATAADWDGPPAVATLPGDLLNLVETLQVPASTPFYITGPESETKILCEALTAAGKTASLWQISESKLHAVGLTAVSPEVLDCPQAAGLALAALDEEPSEFDFIRRPKTQTNASVEWDKKSLIRSLGIAAAILILFLAVSYRTSQKEIRAIRHALTTSHQDTTGEKIIARQQMRERIARARPDMQELLTTLNTCAGNDVLVDSFSFKKGQPVRLVAKTGSFERVYAFQKKLQGSVGIGDVKLISPTMDDKKRQVQFTITFAYRNFSR
jgi:hypothetical protein